jgi:hypothetical protein
MRALCQLYPPPGSIINFPADCISDPPPAQTQILPGGWTGQPLKIQCVRVAGLKYNQRFEFKSGRVADRVDAQREL